MRIIISENQLDVMKSKLKGIIDAEGLEGAAIILDIPIYRLIEWGLVESYDGNLDLRRTPIKSLGNLKYIGGDLNLYKTTLESLGKLESVKGDFYLDSSPLESLGNLKSVGGYLSLSNSQIKSLGDLESVGSDLYLDNTPIEEELKENGMSDDDIKNKFGVKGDLYI